MMMMMVIGMMMMLTMMMMSPIFFFLIYYYPFSLLRFTITIPSDSCNLILHFSCFTERRITSRSESSEDEFVVQRCPSKRMKSDLKSELTHSTFKTKDLIKYPIGYDPKQADEFSYLGSNLDDCQNNTSSSDDEDSNSGCIKTPRDNWRFKAFVIIGPHGTGKSTLISAVANDMGFKVSYSWELVIVKFDERPVLPGRVR